MSPSRRDLIKGMAAGLAGGYIAMRRGFSLAQMGGGGGGGGMGGSGTTVIDPPIGPDLKDPVTISNLSSVPGVVEVNLQPQISQVKINGTTANLMTYNGLFPGPTIRVKKGDLLRVNLTNRLPYTTATNLLGHQRNFTNLHTHGWHVSPQDPGDFVMYKLEPGQTKVHEYNTSMQEAGTLNFYHPHVHGISAEQYWSGLVGALVVEDETDVLAGFETHILILKDIALSGGAPAPHSMMSDYMHGKEGNTVMVNGQVNPRVNAMKGQVQRWRILNASNARFYRLSLEGHTMQLVGTDGGLLDRGYQVSELLISPGERVDVLVKFAYSSGNYRLRALPYSRMGMNGGQTVTLMTATCKGSAVTAQSFPNVVNPDATRLTDTVNTDMAAKRTLTLTMGQMNAYINGQDYDVDPYMIMSNVGTYEIWTINNPSGMDHPFHQHVNAAQVLSITGGDANYASLYTRIPAWKDVVLVPRGGSAKILVPVMDYTGMAMFHCHILEHEDLGMMGHWHLMGDGDTMPM